MKNEQITYVLIAILYGAVGFFLYKKYQSKEKYDNCYYQCKGESNCIDMCEYKLCISNCDKDDDNCEDNCWYKWYD